MDDPPDFELATSLHKRCGIPHLLGEHHTFYAAVTPEVNSMDEGRTKLSSPGNFPQFPVGISSTFSTPNELEKMIASDR